MIRKLWLLFAQVVTVSMAVLFAMQIYRHHSLTLRPDAHITLKESGNPSPQKEIAISSYQLAASKAMPSVVNIFTRKKVVNMDMPFMADELFQRFFGDQFRGRPQFENSLGSGVIVSQEGYILTNHHVVEGAEEIEVAIPNGTKLGAKLIGSDPDTDIAVLRVNLNNLSAITFSSTSNLNIGDVVLAIGNPFGVGQTVTHGIISALGRNHLGINTFENFIQIDAPINPGNSGGALVDTQGNLIGINSAIYSRNGGSIGIGFAIPATLAKQTMQEIIQYGQVTRGWIGVSAQDITPELAESLNLSSKTGAIVTQSNPSGPADKAGIRTGDVIWQIDDGVVANSTEMLNQIVKLKPGTRHIVRIVRNNKRMQVSVVVGQRPVMQQTER